MRRPALRIPAINSRSLAILATVGILVYLVIGPLLMVAFTSFRETQQALP